jgi:hypothetical protein
MKTLKIFAVIIIISIVSAGCAGMGPYTQIGGAAGAGYGAGLGCFTGSILAKNCGMGALGGALIGGPIGAWIGYNSDQKTAAQLQTAVPIGVESCQWTYDSYGNRRWSCSGSITRGREFGPPMDPFQLPPSPSPPHLTKTPTQIPVVYR